MGNNLFGANISGKIAASLGPRLLAGRLIKVNRGTRSADLTAGTNPRRQSVNFRGLVESIDESRIQDSLIGSVRRQVLLLGDTLPTGTVPETDDEIEIEGVTSTIIGDVDRDPDAATYTCWTD